MIACGRPTVQPALGGLRLRDAAIPEGGAYVLTGGNIHEARVVSAQMPWAPHLAFARATLGAKIPSNFRLRAPVRGAPSAPVQGTELAEPR